MRIQGTIIALILMLTFSACGSGGSNVSKDTPAEVQMTVSELRHFDDEARAADIGKVGEVTAIVISAKRAAPNEKELGSHFIHVYAKKGPDEKFQPQISCYTWGYPSLAPGTIVRLKGIIGRGAAMGFSLLNCYVEEI